MTKMNKEFVLIDGSVNAAGFRFLPSGFQKSEFEKNPIGFYHHNQSQGTLLKWVDIKSDAFSVRAFPIINMSHGLANRVVDDIENGFLSVAEFGKFIVLEFSNDKALELPNQTGPTITKWFARECSLVDFEDVNSIGGYNLFDINGTQLDIKKLITKTNLSSMADNNDYDISALLDEAVRAKDITPEVAAELKKQYQSNEKDWRKLSELVRDLSKMRMQELMSYSFDELDQKGLLEELMAKFPDGFQIKYILKFGKPYTGKISKSSKNLTNSEIAEQLLEYAIREGYRDESSRDWLGLTPDDRMIENLIALIIRFFEGSLASSWDDLDKHGDLQRVKERHPAVFRKKYREKFGVDYKE